MCSMSKRLKAGVWTGVLLATLIVIATPAPAALLEVCATCTYTDVESAVAAASGEDTIILDGPAVYSLSAGLVIDSARDGLTIRGTSQVDPDTIEVSFATGPVITVDTGVEFNAEGFTISDGTTGVLVMADATVNMSRCLIQNISGVGVDCVDVSQVTLESSIITGCTAEAAKLDIGGFLDIIQCTFVFNSGVGVNAVAGVTQVEATVIHDSDDGTNGMLGTNTSLQIDGTWVTSAATTVLPPPAGVIDANPILLPLDPTTDFEATGFPGEFVVGRQQSTGAAATLVTPSPARDFANLPRNRTDLTVGADEVVAFGGGTPGWSECYIYQLNELRAYVGEGIMSVDVITDAVDLTGAVMFIELVGTPVTAEFLGPYPINVSGIDTSYGYLDIPIVLDDFIAAFPSAGGAPANYQADYLLYIDTNGGAAPNTATLHGTPTGGIAETTPFGGSRTFGLDTFPPTIVTDFDLLADQYLAPAADGEAIDGPAPSGAAVFPATAWGAGALLGDVGASAGHLNGTAGDPNVFFSALSGGLSYTVRVTFQDVGSGFETNNMPIMRSTTGAANDDVLYREFENYPGLAWWGNNASENSELSAAGVGLDVTYANPSGTELVVDWAFSGLTFNTLAAVQWHTIANIRVTDRAGNEATLDPSGNAYIPLKPLHMWWFPAYEAGVTPGPFARIKSGPSGRETTEPRFTWGMERLGGGQDPADPAPCPPAGRWRVYRAQTPGVAATPWIDVTSDAATGGAYGSADGWSIWLNPLRDATISLDTYFNGTETLRDVINNAGGAGDEFILAVYGYDEAGNTQQVVPGAGNLGSVADLEVNGVAYNRWTNPGLSASLGVDTRVEPFFWHNNTAGGANNGVDGDEQIFGAVSRIPLPEEFCQRVEGRFTINLGLPSGAAAQLPHVWFELLEDGRQVAQGNIGPLAAGTTEYVLTAPFDLIPAAFLNLGRVDCGSGGPDRDRLGDDGDPTAEPGFRRRDVKYVLRVSAGVHVVDDFGNPTFDGLGDPIYAFDQTPATVEFTVTAGEGGNKAPEQAIKIFKRE